MFAISAMFAFYNARRSVSDKDKLQERLGRIPATLLDGLLSRFTESARGSTKCVVLLTVNARTYNGCDAHRAHVTQEMETNLLTHMFALCIRVDEWATDTTIIAGDLSMPIVKVNQLFKSLGTLVAQFSTFFESNLLSFPRRL